MEANLTARLREMTDETVGELHCPDRGFGSPTEIVHAALLAAVRLGMEQAAVIANRAYERNKYCPKECLCGDGEHIAMVIRAAMPKAGGTSDG